MTTFLREVGIIELVLGKMTTRELADWFGISYGSFRNKANEYLDKLNHFASFSKIYGGVQIEEIYVKEYDKNLFKSIDEIFIQEIADSESKLATISGLSRKYQAQLNLKDSAARKQFTKSRDKLFGTIKKDKNYSTGGIMGNRSYRWVIKVNDFNSYRELNQEEDELFNALITQTYSGIDPERIKAAAVLEKRFKDSDMTKEEYFELKEVQGLNFFYEVVEKFKVLTGYQIVCANLYDINYSEVLASDGDRAYRERLRSLIQQEFGN